ncbi:MAG TPA: asparagine synthase-related protein [Candidatus Obscuribacterales bacterium]
MSGICGIINFDGKPVEKDLLHKLLLGIEFLGDNSLYKNINILGINECVAFGYTPTTTTFNNEQLRLTLDGKVYITADARLDARHELIVSLRDKGCRVRADTPDESLILHAYSIWGEGCLKHLSGDFAWAIWDGTREKFLLARDRFGIRTLYYAYIGKTLVFSNSIHCVQSYHEVSEKLNPQAIGDWLLFGRYTWLDKSITTFADIQQVPPAHILIGSRNGIAVQRYWDVPLDTPELHYKNDEDYLEHFRSVMKMAVLDRMRSDKIVISMSGGLDSTTIAAIATRLVKEELLNIELTAFTAVYGRIHPDKERYYSSLVAKKLGLPQVIFACDDYPLLLPQGLSAEPSMDLQPAMRLEMGRQMAALGRVVLTGRSGDNLMRISPPVTVVEMLEQRNPFIASWELWRLKQRYNLLLPLGTRLKAKITGEKKGRDYPNWLNPDFAAQFNLKQRWQSLNEWQPNPIHPRHPEAHKWMVFPDWSLESEYYPGMDYTPPSRTDPFMDLRVVEFILSLPVLPWLHKKYIVRRAMEGELPPEVLARPKTPLGRLHNSLFAQPNLEWADNWQPVPELLEYVQPEFIPSLIDAKCDYPNLHMRPMLLNSWLRNRVQGQPSRFSDWLATGE